MKILIPHFTLFEIVASNTIVLIVLLSCHQQSLLVFMYVGCCADELFPPTIPDAEDEYRSVEEQFYDELGSLFVEQALLCLLYHCFEVRSDA